MCQIYKLLFNSDVFQRDQVIVIQPKYLYRNVADERDFV